MPLQFFNYKTVDRILVQVQVQDLLVTYTIIQRVFVTGMTRRETFGSKCKLFIIIHGQYRQGRAGANGYGIDKTEE